MAEVSHLHLYEDDDSDDVVNFDDMPYWSHSLDSEQSLEVNISDAFDLYDLESSVHIGGLDYRSETDSVTGEVFDRENQVSFVRDLLQQRVEQYSARFDFDEFENFDNSNNPEFDLDSGLGVHVEHDGCSSREEFFARMMSRSEQSDVDGDDGGLEDVYGWEGDVFDEGDGIDALSVVIEGDVADSILIEEPGVDNVNNLDWEVLLTAADLNIDYDSDPDAYSADYDVLFGRGEVDIDIDIDTSPLIQPPAGRAIIENLPTVIMTKDDVLKNNNVCAVCKDEMVVGGRVKELPCSHRYHGDCVIPWLKIKNTCPVCRHELSTDDPEYELHKKLQRSRVNGI